MKYPKQVKIVEVGPRDGLQNESTPLSLETKIELINRLNAAGFHNIESGAFVSPKWVPQMASSAAVMTGITRKPGVLYSVLVPNMQGFEAALAAKADEVVIFAAASEAFSQKNINCSIAESIERFRPVAAAAKANGLRLRAAISCALGCPYQGAVPVSAVVDCAQQMADLGCDDIGVADTIGVGTPAHAYRVFEAVAKRYPIEQISAHFHDTYGQACANILACLDLGVTTFDAAVAGLGGCPYAKGATGNVATEDVLYMLHGMGIETGIDLDVVCDVGRFISAAIGRPPLSRVNKALSIKAGLLNA